MGEGIKELTVVDVHFWCCEIFIFVYRVGALGVNAELSVAEESGEAEESEAAEESCVVNRGEGDLEDNSQSIIGGGWLRVHSNGAYNL